MQFLKGENKIRLFLGGLFEYQEQVSFEGLIDKNPLRFDFEVKVSDKSFLIEFQGKQHYEPVRYFGGIARLTDQQKKDQLKRDYCIANKIPLLEIKYDDEDWENKIKVFLNISA